MPNSKNSKNHHNQQEPLPVLWNIYSPVLSTGDENDVLTGSTLEKMTQWEALISTNKN
jgi:hypothetical protein